MVIICHGIGFCEDILNFDNQNAVYFDQFSKNYDISPIINDKFFKEQYGQKFLYEKALNFINYVEQNELDPQNNDKTLEYAIKLYRLYLDYLLEKTDLLVFTDTLYKYKYEIWEINRNYSESQKKKTTPFANISSINNVLKIIQNPSLIEEGFAKINKTPTLDEMLRNFTAEIAFLIEKYQKEGQDLNNCRIVEDCFLKYGFYTGIKRNDFPPDMQGLTEYLDSLYLTIAIVTSNNKKNHKRAKAMNEELIKDLESMIQEIPFRKAAVTTEAAKLMLKIDSFFQGFFISNTVEKFIKRSFENIEYLIEGYDSYTYEYIYTLNYIKAFDAGFKGPR